MNRELIQKARVLGVDRVANLTGKGRDEVSRWMSGGVNATVEAAVLAALTPPKPQK